MKLSELPWITKVYSDKQQKFVNFFTRQEFIAVFTTADDGTYNIIFNVLHGKSGPLFKVSAVEAQCVLYDLLETHERLYYDEYARALVPSHGRRSADGGAHQSRALDGEDGRHGGDADAARTDGGGPPEFDVFEQIGE